ncbi:MAG: galactose oxidase [Bacteroidales bacterium]|nr:galactose oxidase [Bacteroidales bacterium]
MKEKKKYTEYLRYAFLLICSVMVLISCSDDDDDTTEYVGNWVELSDFEGVTRSDAVAFSIGNKGYVGTGYDGYNRLSDFWEYDPELNTWLQKADFPGAARNGAVGFSINNKGYIGTGFNGITRMNDFWEFDPGSNTWQRKADFAGSARYGAVGFSIADKGYLGTGFDGNYLKDFWEYDPAADTWTQKMSVGGSKRRDALSFVIDSKGYICTGINNGVYENDFWEFDPLTGVWTEKNSIADVSSEDFDDDYTITGINKVAFSLSGRGFVATGGEGSAGTQVWEYDPVADLWQQKTAFEGSARADAVAFTIGNRAYLTTGRSSSYYFDDLWAFNPDDEYDSYD